MSSASTCSPAWHFSELVFCSSLFEPRSDIFFVLLVVFVVVLWSICSHTSWSRDVQSLLQPTLVDHCSQPVCALTTRKAVHVVSSFWCVSAPSAVCVTGIRACTHIWSHRFSLVMRGHPHVIRWAHVYIGACLFMYLLRSRVYTWHKGTHSMGPWKCGTHCGLFAEHSKQKVPSPVQCGPRVLPLGHSIELHSLLASRRWDPSHLPIRRPSLFSSPKNPVRPPSFSRPVVPRVTHPTTTTTG